MASRDVRVRLSSLNKHKINPLLMLLVMLAWCADITVDEESE
jgi:hypothetical protein